MNTSASRQFFQGLALVLLALCKVSFAAGKQTQYQRSLKDIERYICQEKFQDAVPLVLQTPEVSPCFNYLATLDLYANKKSENNKEELINMTEIIRLIQKHKECKERQKINDEEEFSYNVIIKQCASNLNKINNSLIAARKSLQLHKSGAIVSLTAGTAALVGALALGLGSRYPSTCYSTDGIPPAMDGRELSCVYPNNYLIGTPILVAAGIGLTIGGIYLERGAASRGKELPEGDKGPLPVDCPQAGENKLPDVIVKEHCAALLKDGAVP